jgi:hypothetical protein
MRYGGVERVVEGVKRRRLVVEDTASVAAAGTSSPVVDLVPEKDITEASVFDLEILECTICTEPLASPIYQVRSGARCFHHMLLGSCIW